MPPDDPFEEFGVADKDNESEDSTATPATNADPFAEFDSPISYEDPFADFGFAETPTVEESRGFIGRAIDQLIAGEYQRRATNSGARAVSRMREEQQVEDEVPGAGGTAFNYQTMVASMHRATDERLARVDDPETQEYLRTRQRRRDADLERERLRETARLRKEAAEALQRSVEYTAKYNEIPLSEATQEFMDENSERGAWEIFRENPIAIITDLGLRSLPTSLESTAYGLGGAAVGGLPGFMVGVGAGSAKTEFAHSILDAIHEHQIDVTDPDAVAAFVTDREIMDDVERRAARRAVTIGGFDALAAFFGGRVLSPFAEPLKRHTTNVAVQLGLQSGLGASGEAVGQIAEGRDSINPREVAAEAVGELVTGPVEVAGAALSARRDARENTPTRQRLRRLAELERKFSQNSMTGQDMQDLEELRAAYLRGELDDSAEDSAGVLDELEKEAEAAAEQARAGVATRGGDTLEQETAAATAATESRQRNATRRQAAQARVDADAQRLEEEAEYAETQRAEDEARSQIQLAAAQRYEQQVAALRASPGFEAREAADARQRESEENEARYQQELQIGEAAAAEAASRPTLGDVASPEVRAFRPSQVPQEPVVEETPAPAAEKPRSEIPALPAPSPEPVIVSPEGIAATPGQRRELGIGPERPLAAPTPEPKKLTLRQRRQQKQAERAARRATIRAQAEQSAASVANELPEPTQGQIEAGNYRKGHVRGSEIGVPGVDITFENARGDTRRGSELQDHYGYIKRTEGADGDQVDVFVNPSIDTSQHANPDNQPVFVVDQLNEEGGFDEHKVMIGYPSQRSARRAYARNYPSGWNVGPVTQMTLGEFKTWLREGSQTRPVSGAIHPPAQPKATAGRRPSVREQRAARRLKRLQYRFADEQFEVNDASEIQGEGAIEIVADDGTGRTAQIIVKPRGDDYQIVFSGVSSELRGQGKGQQLLERAYAFARSEKRGLVSDSQVSLQQLQVYEALKRKGWTVEYSDPKEVEKVLSGRSPQGQVDTRGTRPVVTRIEPPARSQLRLDDAQQAPVGLSIDETQTALQPLIDELKGLRPQIVASFGELPARTQTQIYRDGVNPSKVKAVYDPTTDEIFVVAENHRTADDAVETLLHEGVAHKGLRYLLGDQFDVVMDAVYESIKGRSGLKRVAKRYGYDLSDKAQRLQAVDEYIAELAEKPDNRSLLKRVYDAIRAVLRQLGVVRQWTDGDLRQLLKESRQKLAIDPAAPAASTPSASYRLTDEFRRWFGNSKIVDEDTGEPLVVYHGTRAFSDFDEFSVDGPPYDEAVEGTRSSGSGNDPTAFLGAHFSREPKVANYFASQRTYGGVRQEEGDGRVYPVYLSIKNPMYLRETELQNLIWDHGTLPDDMLETYAERVYGDPYYDQLSRRDMREAFDMLADQYEDGGLEAIRELAFTAKLAFEKMGYDGVAYDNEVEGGISYIAFAPTQIKSAVGNRGTFDPNDARIQYRLEDEKTTPPDAKHPNPLGQLHAMAATMEEQADYSPNAIQQTVDRFRDAGVKAQRLVLGAIPRRHVLDFVTEGKMPAGREYVRLAQRMDGRRNEIMSAGEPIGQRWQKFTSKNKAQGRILGELMHASTLAGVDPSMAQYPAHDDPAIDAKRRADHRILRKWWSKLDAEAQQIYTDVRDNYREQRKLVMAALEARINATQAEGETRKALIAQLRKQFEAGRVQGPYFPLMRFGDFWAAARDAQGETVAFSRFEKPSLQRKWVAEMKRAGFDVSQGQRMLDKDIAEAVSPTFAAKVTSLVKKVDPEIADEIWQMYLATLPEMSMRKAFMHRKGRLGFSMDALRAFGHSVFHGAHQIARLEHMYEMEKTLEELRDEAAALATKNDKEQYWAASVYGEMLDRHKWAKNPTASPLATALTGLGFAWYLGTTPAAAAVNLSQTPLVAFPVLGAKFGMTKAAKELARASTAYAGSRGPLKNRLRDDERKAFEEAQRIGLFEKTQAFDLAGLAESGLDYSSRWRQAANMMAYLFHKAEEANRQITFLAGYRLAREKGVVHDEAILQAEELVWDSHFDYSNTNRPRYVQNDIMKVLFLFRNYSLNMTYRLVRDFKEAIAGASPQQRKEARKRFGGIMMMAGLFGGLTGLPVVWTVARLLESMFDDPEDPYDAQEAAYAYLAESMGSRAAMAFMRGPVDAASGATISTRVSLAHLWMREPQAGLEGTEVFAHYLGELAGPVPGILEDMFQAKMAYRKTGDSFRALEYFMPKVLEDQLKAFRYLREGALNYRGDEYLSSEHFSNWELFMQSMGFVPSELQQRYDEMKGIRNTEARIINRRQALMDQLFAAARNSDRTGVQEAFAAITDFNQTNPGAAIDGNVIMRSAAARQSAAEQTLRGVRVSNTNLRYLHNELQLTEK